MTIQIMLNRRQRAALFVMAVIALASLSAYEGPPARAQPAAAPPPAVTVVKVARKEVTPTLSFTGRIEAMDKVELRARVQGFLEKRLFEEGADVKEGDLLYVIEKAPYQARISEINAAISGAEGTLRFTSLELERQETLVQRQVAAQARLDEARSRQAEARAELLKNKASLEKAELDLGYTDIHSPLSGRIGRSLFSVGSFVEPSSGNLATIVRQDPIYATFPLSQREALAIRKRAEEEGGSPRAFVVRLRLADGSLYPEKGTVDFIDVQFNATTDSVIVRAKFPNPKRLLIDGQLITVIAESTTVEHALFVPQQALQTDQAGSFVLLVDKDNKVLVRRVQLGQGREAEIAVTGGLEEGERVIAEGVQKVRPNQVVQPTEAAATVKPQ